MRGLRSIAYNAIFRRNSTYVGFIIAGAVVGEQIVDKVFDDFWESHNKEKLFHNQEFSKDE
eukprot:CAMPEP_0114539222 /NCGR_PEP_ID=MMETSP0114-20121206/125_1 /TAXON_ID=31324 /ORGANISM="Goniomonas sp, Strain m" /LENGTH=60 /DNA_ID=CAMNT_0001723315 /DNA_START=21 /DNA_END=203 /DNA_ORIENTATION=+